MSGSGGGSVIEEFLVSLGAKVDVKEFYSGIDNMSKAVAKFSLGLSGMITALKGALIATASALENLYFTAQRAGTTVDSLKALQYGMQQIGLSAGDANQALEGLAMSMQLNPGNESLLRYLGVQTRSVGGAMRDSSQVMGDFIARLGKMPFYIAAQYAETFGINARTLKMLLANYGELRLKEEEFRNLARAVGVDLEDSGKKSHAFMNELRAVGEVIELMWIKVSTVLIQRLRPEIEAFRKFLLDHNKEITNFAIEVGNSILGVSDDIVKMLPEIDKLIKATIGWKDVLQAVADIIAYRIFGPLGFIASLLYQLYGKEQEAEKNHPGPKRAPDGTLDPAAPATKRFFDDNHSMIETLKQWLGKHLYPPLLHDYGDGGMGTPYDPNAPAPPSPPLTKPLDGMDRPMPWGGRQLPESAPSSGTQQALPGFERTAFRPTSGSDPIGIRQNNPGNLRQWAGAGSSGGFAVFRDAMQGLTAMRDNLLAYAAKGRDTIASIIQHWAPSSENNTAAYIANLARMMGVGAGEHLNMRDPRVLAALMNGITRIENGFNPYSAATVNRAASASLGGADAGRGGNVTIHQNTDIHVHGSDPHPTAKATSNQQEAVNANLVRRFRTAVIA